MKGVREMLDCVADVSVCAFLIAGDGVCGGIRAGFTEGMVVT